MSVRPQVTLDIEAASHQGALLYHKHRDTQLTKSETEKAAGGLFLPILDFFLSDFISFALFAPKKTQSVSTD